MLLSLNIGFSVLIIIKFIYSSKVGICNRLLHGIFHICPGISPRLPYQARGRSPRADMGRGLIPGQIWKMPGNDLFITHFQAGEMECPVGYTSLNGSACFPCYVGQYGRRCFNICACEENERCHHVYGCVPLVSHDSTTVPETTLYHEEATPAYHEEITPAYHEEITPEYHAETTPAYHETITSAFHQTTTSVYHVTSVYYSTMIMISKSTFPNNNFLGISMKDVIMYSLTILILFALILVICYLRTKRNREADTQLSERNINTRSDSTSRTTEGIYHTIDENALDESLHANQSEYEEPVVTRCKHFNKSDGKIKAANDEITIQIDTESEKSSEVHPESISDYLNPYQLVKATACRLDSAYTDVFNNTESSGNAFNPEIDSCLNPYYVVKKSSEQDMENHGLLMTTIHGNEDIIQGKENGECSSSSDGSYQLYYLKH